jgi:hypothetical protein
MMKWHDFLVHQARFPFPEMDEDGYANTTNVSREEVQCVLPGWRAQFAV